MQVVEYQALTQVAEEVQGDIENLQAQLQDVIPYLQEESHLQQQSQFQQHLIQLQLEEAEQLHQDLLLKELVVVIQFFQQ